MLRHPIFRPPVLLFATFLALASLRATESAVAPTIATQPANAAAVAGQPVTLTVAATGSGTLTYQWRRNGFPIAGATSASYTIASASRTDADFYDVIVGEGQSTATSTTVRLDVAPSADPGLLMIDPTWRVELETTQASINTVLPLADGKFLAAGDFSRVNGHATGDVARFNADGTIDPSFTAPVLDGGVGSLAVQSSGKILVAGSFKLVVGSATRRNLIRLEADGTLDPTFNPGGSGANSSVSSLAVGPGDKIYACGSFWEYNGYGRFSLVGLNADGSVDGDFYADVGRTSGVVKALLPLADGKVLIGGSFTQVNFTARNRLARLDRFGNVDPSFDPGVGPDETVYALALSPDGRIYAGGAFKNFNGASAAGYLRLDAGGGPDSTFVASGFTGDGVYSLFVQADGKVLLGGSFSGIRGADVRYLARVATDGTLDASAAPHFNSTVNRAVTMGDGKLLAAGSFFSAGGVPRAGLARINADGSLDSTLDPVLRQRGSMSSIVPVPGGKLAITGDFTTVNGVARDHVAQINADGTLDLSFLAGSTANSRVDHLVRQGDGKLILAGSFSFFAGYARPGLVRVQANGAIDLSFSPVSDLGQSSPAALISQALLPLGSGRLAYVGEFYNPYLGWGGNLMTIRRLKADGSADPSGTVSADASIDQITLDADGKIYVGGYFNAMGGFARARLARLNADGTVDPGYDPMGDASAKVTALATAPDGALWLGGYHYLADRTALARPILGRVLDSGALDPAFSNVPFDTDSAESGGVNDLLPQRNGQVIVAGYFSPLTGAPFTGHLARLNADGSVDPTFGIAGLPDGVQHLVQADDGQLYLVGRNYFVRTTAAEIPAITTQPLTQTRTTGETVVLSVTVSATASVSYQWAHDGTPIVGATTATLTLPAITTVAGGAYSVTVTSSNGIGIVRSTPAVLTVVGPVVVTGGTTWQTLFEGNNAKFSINASGVSTYAWQQSRDGGVNWDSLADGDGFSGTATASLTVNHVTTGMTGRSYRVALSNGSGSVFSTAMPLSVLSTNRSVGTAWLGGDGGASLPLTTPKAIAGDVIEVAAGREYTLFITKDGALWAVGENVSGQLGDGTALARNQPVKVASGVKTAAAGTYHSAFVKMDGTLWTMGSNSTGALGDGTVIQRASPVQVASEVATVATGGAQTLFVKTDGTLWAMGTNFNGQLGDGSTTNRSTPVQVATGVSAAATLAAESYFIKADGTLWGMGANANGQFGVTGQRTSAVQITSGVSRVAAGESYLMCVKMDGTLWGAGYNSSGQLGDGTQVSRSAAVQIAAAVSDVMANASGQTFFLKADGTLWGMGRNAAGLFGDPSTVTTQLTPMRVATGVFRATISNGIAGSASKGHLMFITNDGVLHGVGDNTHGQLGDRQDPNRLPLATDVISAAASTNGDLAALAVKSDGTLWRRRGHGPFQLVPSVSGVLEAIMGPYDSDELYLKADGTLWRLSYDNTVAKLADEVVAAGAGLNYFAFLKTDGSLWGKGGDNSMIQFGDGVAPTKIDDRVLSFAAAGWHLLYVRDDHKLWGIGSPWLGFGDAYTWNQFASTPVQLESGVRFAAATSNQNLFVKTDGTLWTRGPGWRNVVGPAVQVDGDVVSAVAASSGAYYLKADAVLRARTGFFGELGAITEGAGGIVALRAVEDGLVYIQAANFGTVPTIAANPPATVAVLGTPLSLQADVSGSGPFSYQWFKDGQAISWARAARFNLPYVTATDLGRYTVTVTNSAGSVTSAVATVTVPGIELPPVIATQPTGKAGTIGSNVSFAVVATGTGPLSYQWRKGASNLINDSRITGATTATLSITGLIAADAGNYSVVVSAAGGSTTSSAAALAVLEAQATQSVVGGGYLAGGTVTLANAVTYTGAVSGLSWSVLLPDGWSYASSTASAPATQPTVGDTGLIEWTWTTMPASPVTFSYTLNVPAGTTGAHPVAAQVLARQASLEVQLLAQPDPLSVYEALHHSADTNRDFKLSLSELLRVIELYNTRNGTTRTGRYQLQSGTEDSFGPDPLTASGATVTLDTYHSADTTRDGKLSLSELLRVIELYNYRNGSTRTGQYHGLRDGETLTEDRFGPGA